MAQMHPNPRRRHLPTLLVAAIAALALGACNTLSELHVGDDTGSNDTAVDLGDDVAPSGRCDDLVVAEPFETLLLDPAGGCFAVPTAGAPTTWTGRAELVEVDTLTPDADTIVAIDTRERLDDSGVWDVVWIQRAGNTLRLVSSAYDLSADPPVVVEEDTLVDELMVPASQLPEVYNTVAGLSLVDVEGTRVVLLVLEDGSFYWLPLGEADAALTRLEPTINDLRWNASAGAMALGSYASEPGIVLTYANFAPYFLGQLGSNANTNFVATGPLRFSSADPGVLELPLGVVPRTPPPTAAQPPFRHRHTFDLSLVQSTTNIPSTTFAEAGAKVLVSADPECTDTLGCPFRLERGEPALSTLVYNPGGGAPTVAQAEDGALSTILTEVRMGALDWIASQQAAVDAPDVAVTHVAVTGIGSTLLTLSVPVYLGCHVEGTYQPCAPTQSDDVVLIPTGTLTSVWTVSGGIPRAPSASFASDFVVNDAAAIDGRQFGASSETLFLLIVGTKTSGSQPVSGLTLLAAGEGIGTPDSPSEMLFQMPLSALEGTLTEPVNFAVAGPLLFVPAGDNVAVYTIVAR